MNDTVRLLTALLFGISACAICYVSWIKMGPPAWSESKSSQTIKPPSDIDFITSIIKKRKWLALEEADQLDKLKFVDTNANNECEDLPDSDNDRRARHMGSGRTYSYWANQARMRRKQAAAKRRLEALEKHRELMSNSVAKTGK
ncbi:hypothetical protein PMIN06_002221 [Paraphaeosphaeria minitans]